MDEQEREVPVQRNAYEKSPQPDREGLSSISEAAHEKRTKTIDNFVTV
jgi:hypothetical protein